MEGLPNFMVHQILSHVPGNDLRRSKRVCRRFNHLITTYEKDFRRPTLAMTIGSEERNYSYFSVKLHFKSEVAELKLEIYGNREVIPCSPAVTAFIDPFKKYCEDRFSSNNGDDERSHFHFFRWLCQTVNVNELTIHPETGWKSRFSMITRAMKMSQNKCELVTMIGGACVLPEEKGEDELRRFYLVQKALNVKTEWRMKWVENYGTIARFNNFGSWIHSDIFSVIVVSINYTLMLSVLQTIREGWISSGSIAVKHPIRVEYDSRCIPSDEAVEHGIRFRCDNIRLYDLLQLLNFESFENLPDVVTCTGKSSKLVFNLEKKERCAIVTVEILPLE